MFRHTKDTGAQKTSRSAADAVSATPRSTGVVQRVFTEKKGNNTAGMRSDIRTHRKSNGHWNYTGCQKNYAVDADNHDIYEHSDEGGHSERNLLGKMLIEGHDAGDPVNIHTERATCLSCYEYLKGLHDDKVGTAKAFNMTITYTVDYPGDGDSKGELHEYYNTKSDMPDKRGGS